MPCDTGEGVAGEIGTELGTDFNKKRFQSSQDKIHTYKYFVKKSVTHPQSKQKKNKQRICISIVILEAENIF